MGGPNEEVYQGSPDCLEIDEIIDNCDEERVANYYDQYIGAGVVIPYWKGDKLMGKVRKRFRYDDIITGEGNYNAMHDKSLYEVEYPDGTTEQLAANIIDENVISQVDSEGHQYHLLTEVTYHKKYDIDISNVGGFIKSSSRDLYWKSTTRGWKLVVEYKYGLVYWVPLKDLKQANRVDMAEYSVANEISDEPAFNWWVKDTLRHRDRIISQVKSKYWYSSHNFWIQVLKTVKEEYKIDRQSGTDFWTKDISKQMTKFLIVFDNIDGVTPDWMSKGKIKPGYEHVNAHMIFDIKMDGKFTRKSILVVDVHTTAPSS